MTCPHVFVRAEIRDDLLGRPDPHPLIVWSCTRCGEQGHPIPEGATR